MADGERDYKIRFIAEMQEAASAFSTFFGGLDGGVERAKRAFANLQSAAEGVANVISKGDAFLNVQASFNKIQAAAGNTAGIEKLRAAVGGVISDFDLMKSSNIAASFGVTADQFERLAANADALADITGGDAVDALNAMTRAAGTGEGRMLRMFGVTVEGAKNSEEVIKQLEEQVSKLAAESGSAGDAADSLKVALANQADKAAAAFTKSKELGQVLESLAKFVNSADWTSWIDNLGKGLVVLQNKASEVADGFSALGKVISGQTPEQAAGEIFGKRIADGLVKIGASWKGITTETKKTAVELGVVFHATEKAAKATEEAKKKQEEWNKVVRDLDTRELAEGLQAAINSFSDTDFQAYKAQIYKNAYYAFIEAHKDVANSAELAEGARRAAELEANQVADARVDAMINANTKIVDDWQTKQREAFETAADIWASLLSDAISGDLFDPENLKRKLAEVATDFGSQILAGMTTGGGQGGGGWLAAAGSLFGGGGGGGGASYGPYANGDAYAEALAASSSSGNTASFSGSWYEIAARLYVAMLVRDYEQFKKADTSEGQWLAAAGTYIDTIFPGIGTIIAGGLSYLGVGAAGSGLQEEIARGDLVEFLEDKYGNTHDFQIPGISGGQPTTLGLNPSDFNVDFSRPNADQAVGLVQGLADVVTQGDDKLGNDLTGIFTNAILEGENFNEVLINATALLDSFGITAEQGKAELENLFLDGQISLDEFGAGIQGFNLLATENLVGEGSINDALNVIFGNLESKPRVAIKGLELLWTELGERGITTLEGFSTYLSDTFGVDAQSVFATIEAAGITSFEDLTNLSEDQLYILLQQFTTIAEQMGNALGLNIEEGAGKATNSLDSVEQKIKKVGDTFVTAMSGSSSNAADAFHSHAERIISDLNNIEEAAHDAASATDNVGGSSGSGGRPNSNSQATRRAIYPSVNKLNRADL